MNKLLILTSIVWFAVATSCLASDKIWKVYTYPTGHFSISFPGRPEEKAENDDAIEGRPFVIHMISYAVTDNEAYLASWIDMTDVFPEEKEIKQILEDSRDGACRSMKTTKIETTKLNLDGNPYIEFIASNESFIAKDRIYVIKKFQYSIITIYSTETGILPDADRFINSFKPQAFEIQPKKEKLPPVKNNSWITYYPQNSYISLSLPSKPKESTRVESIGTDSLNIHLISTAVNDDEAYVASWTDMSEIYPPDKQLSKEDLKQVLEEGRDGVANSMNAKEVNTLTTFLGENPYIEFTASSSLFIAKVRMYMIGKYQYSLLAMYSKSSGIKSDADKFLNSLKIMDSKNLATDENAQPAKKSKGSEWVNFSPAGGNFEVKFPRKPEESAKDVNSGSEAIPVHFARLVNDDGSVYVSSWADFSVSLNGDKETDIKTLLEKSRDGATGKLGATKVKTLETNLNGNPYIEFIASSDELIMKARIYMVNNFQYCLLAMYSGKEGIPPDADKFIQSFKLNTRK